MNRYYEPRGRRRSRQGLTKNHKIAIACAGVVVLFGGLMYAVGEPEQPQAQEIIWIAEKTTRSPGVIPSALRRRIQEAADEGGASLTAYAVGQRAEKIGSVSLDATLDGDRIDDPVRRASVIDGRVSTLAGRLAQSPAGSDGFSLYQALRVGADEGASAGVPVEVWLSTTVLTGSVDPLSIPTLTENEADPSQAVDELKKGSLGRLDLGLVNLHVIMLSPVGAGQEPLSPRSESWRATFVKTLAEQLGATVTDPLRENSTRPAWPNSSAVPAIVPMPEPTPVTPPPPVVKDEPPPPPRIDNAAFEPDEATLLDPAAVHVAVSAVVAAYKAQPGRYRVVVVGYCARIGGRDGAVRLSKERAEAIAALLQNDGIDRADVETRGAGFDELADPTQPPVSPAQRVVVIQLVTR
ncbi:OmpA family protein [Actinophytocola oryzae]|uniref:Outer membrane protein OmpA-like peptidoglycan-associated protein n=1 Tax=Actinophytocola oryzae TaxID=502181 RepID=A0A4V3FV08_9PSEU|nr:OmpA family protein [Actinophytocola oryzae]TDV57281.1 outer membrane protein OmpA-like peptidoglycan-associated protein [Actinophytocola oryzae]